MENKKKLKYVKLFFILSAALVIFLSTALNGHAKPFPDEQVNLVVPSSIEINQMSDGGIVVSDFIIENKTPVAFNIENIRATPFNGWSLETIKENLSFNKKNILVAMEGHMLNNGDNSVNIPIKFNSNQSVKIDINMHCFEQKSSEKAFEFVMDYKLVPRKFAISFFNPKGGSYRPIYGLCGETIDLPNLDLPNFIGWSDFYSHEFHGLSMKIPIGGTRVVATYKQTVLDVNKFRNLPFMTESNGQDVPVAGLTLKYGHPSNLDFEYWDVSKQGNNSVICYRESQEPNSSQYNNIIVAADESEMDIEGNVTRLFSGADGVNTTFKFFRSENQNFRMTFGNINYLFDGCRELVDISGFSMLMTKNFIAMEGAFKDCKKLNDMSPLAIISASKLQNLKDAFYGCQFSDTVFLENWNLVNALDCSGMFSNCNNLKSINLGNWSISSRCILDNMFLNTPLELGYAKDQEMVDRLNQATTGIFNNCFQIKQQPSQ